MGEADSLAAMEEEGSLAETAVGEEEEEVMAEAAAEAVEVVMEVEVVEEDAR